MEGQLGTFFDWENEASHDAHMLSSVQGPEQGELALPNADVGADSTVTAVSAGSDFTCALFDAGGVKCWGASARSRSCCARAPWSAGHAEAR